jgi:hypothetical protein
MTKKAIVPYSILTPTVWDMINSVAKRTEDSRDYGQREAQIAIKMAVAHEHGIPITSALSSVYVIDNKPTLAPKLVWAKIVVHSDFAGFEEKRLTDGNGGFYGWEITLKRKNGMQATRRFTMDDARRIIVNRDGKTLAEKDNYKNYAEQVCYWRAMGFVEDVVFPDVGQGLYPSDALGADITPDGDVINTATWTEVTESPPQTPPKNEGSNGKDPIPEPVKASDAPSTPIEAKQPEPVSETPAPEAPAQPEPVNEVSEVRTAADILAAGFDVGAIQAAVSALKEAGQDVHFPPASVEECQAVMAKLQEVKKNV